MSGTWSLGVLVGGPILALTIVGSALLVRKAWHWFSEQDRDEEYGDWGLALVVSCVGSVALLSLVIGIAFGYYPYKAEYHQWRPVTGEVAQVSKSLVAEGEGMSEKIVVRYKGSGQEYGCEDTRCSLLAVGDELDLNCKRAWQYASTDGYDCRFVERRAS